MAKLRVSKLVKSTSSTHTEVSPHVLTTPEVELLHCATTRTKPLKEEKEGQEKGGQEEEGEREEGEREEGR